MIADVALHARAVCLWLSPSSVRTKTDVRTAADEHEGMTVWVSCTES